MLTGCIESPAYLLGSLWWIGSTFTWLLGLGFLLSKGRGIRRAMSIIGGIGGIVFGLWGTAHAFGLLFFDVQPCIPFLSLYREGTLPLMDLDIPCYVLDTGQRVIGRTAMTEMLTGIKGGGGLEKYIGVSPLKPFINLDNVLEKNDALGETAEEHAFESATCAQCRTDIPVCELLPWTAPEAGE